MSLLDGRFTRRRFMGAAAAGAGLMAAGLPQSVVDVLAAPARCGRLEDIEHVVILIQENRSFDNYFGAYRGVRGFDDAKVLIQANGLPIFDQSTGGALDRGYLQPFHLDTTKTQAECTNDISHAWDLQHKTWNGGLMNAFVTEHIKNDPVNGPLTMGYYNRADLDFYYALADAFTICDGYHCSVIGPTDPNRLYSMSAWLGQDGTRGGPILTTSSSRLGNFNTLGWTTYPEQLQAAGITWKVYGTADGHFGDNVLPYFKSFWSNPQLAARGMDPTFPATFLADVEAGTLPSVSWVLASLVDTEHPPAPPKGGEAVVSQILTALTSNPGVWAKTALFVTYDENGGFFDHVPPPVAPAGTPGEYLSVSPLPSDAGGIAGPVGLGFRVPLLVISPLSRGGFVCPTTVDHTSLLRFLETRFGPEVPNLSEWRRSVTGDLTEAFNFAKPANTSVPALPAALPLDQTQLMECIPSSIISEADSGGNPGGLNPPYPIPPNSTPHQEPGSAKTPSGLPDCAPHRGGGKGEKAGPAGTTTRPAAPAAGHKAVTARLTAATTSAHGAMLAEGILAGAGVMAAAAGVNWIVRRRAELAAGVESERE